MSENKASPSDCEQEAHENRNTAPQSSSGPGFGTPATLSFVGGNLTDAGARPPQTSPTTDPAPLFSPILNYEAPTIVAVNQESQAQGERYANTDQGPNVSTGVVLVSEEVSSSISCGFVGNTVKLLTETIGGVLGLNDVDDSPTIENEDNRSKASAEHSSVILRELIQQITHARQPPDEQLNAIPIEETQFRSICFACSEASVTLKLDDAELTYMTDERSVVKYRESVMKLNESEGKTSALNHLKSLLKDPHLKLDNLTFEVRGEGRCIQIDLEHWIFTAMRTFLRTLRTTVHVKQLTLNKFKLESVCSLFEFFTPVALQSIVLLPKKDTNLEEVNYLNHLKQVVGLSQWRGATQLTMRFDLEVNNLPKSYFSHFRRVTILNEASYPSEMEHVEKIIHLLSNSRELIIQARKSWAAGYNRSVGSGQHGLGCSNDRTDESIATWRVRESNVVYEIHEIHPDSQQCLLKKRIMNA